MIDRVEAWLRSTFAILRTHPRLTFALALLIAAIIISPIPPIP